MEFKNELHPKNYLLIEVFSRTFLANFIRAREFRHFAATMLFQTHRAFGCLDDVVDIHLPAADGEKDGTNWRRSVNSRSRGADRLNSRLGKYYIKKKRINPRCHHLNFFLCFSFVLNGFLKIIQNIPKADNYALVKIMLALNISAYDGRSAYLTITCLLLVNQKDKESKQFI